MTTEQNLTKARAKVLCTHFFRWWWNKPGSNTDEGFEDWWEIEGFALEEAEAADREQTVRWRTMDSAPKDGTRVLAWCDAFDVSYGRDYLSGVATVAWDDGAWFVDPGSAYEITVQPSHWMPLPAAPALPGASS